MHIYRYLKKYFAQCFKIIFRLVWIFFSFFTTAHLLANYLAVTCIVIEIFNQSRLHIVAAQFFSSGSCPTVKETNYAEPVLLGELMNFGKRL